MIEDLQPQYGQPVWIPVMTLRNSGKPCICYHPWSTDEGCDCDLPTDSKESGRNELSV